MSSSVFLTFDPNTAGVTLEQWREFCEEHRIRHSPETGLGNVYYQDAVTEITHESHRLTFSTYFMGSAMPNVARLAMLAWERWGGSLAASPELRGIIAQQAASSPPPAVTPPAKSMPPRVKPGECRAMVGGSLGILWCDLPSGHAEAHRWQSEHGPIGDFRDPVKPDPNDDRSVVERLRSHQRGERSALELLEELAARRLGATVPTWSVITLGTRDTYDATTVPHTLTRDWSMRLLGHDGHSLRRFYGSDLALLIAQAHAAKPDDE